MLGKLIEKLIAVRLFEGFQYITNCVNANGDDIEAMVDVSREISYKTFLKYVDIADFTQVLMSLGYVVGREKGLHVKDDWAVRFYKSKYKGQPCVYMLQSAIEYVFG